MADSDRGKTSPVKQDLLENPAGYSFFQAMYLLWRFLEKSHPEAADINFFYKHMRVRPELSLAFPGSDISAITEIEDEDGQPRYNITATFLGLYGSSSPLPTFYTEDLIDEASEDASSTRDFLDVVNSPFYPLLTAAVAKYRLYFQANERRSPEVVDRLFSLLGYGHETMRNMLSEPRRLLRYIGLFTQWPRSAMGLRTLISDALGGAPVDVFPNLERRVRIPDDQRCILSEQGCLLGEDAHLGCEIIDIMGKIRIVIGPLPDEAFHECLPGRDKFSWIEELIDIYFSEPMEYRLEVAPAREDVRPARPGGEKWGALGHDAWVFSGEAPETCRAVFELQKREAPHDSCRY